MDEIIRIKRVSSMMITAHSVLRDRYSSLSSFFENSLLVASAFLNGLIFIDANFIYNLTGITPNYQKVCMGLFSILIFAISVVLIQVKWKEKAEDHEKAATEYFNLYQESKSILSSEPSAIDETSMKFIKRYTDITSTIKKIPDRKFNELKLRHYRKIALSNLIDKHPGSLLIILKLKLLIASFREKNQ